MRFNSARDFTVIKEMVFGTGEDVVTLINHNPQWENFTPEEYDRIHT